jgi:hypothetical protein
VSLVPNSGSANDSLTPQNKLREAQGSNENSAGEMTPYEMTPYDHKERGFSLAISSNESV